MMEERRKQKMESRENDTRRRAEKRTEVGEQRKGKKAGG